MAEYDEPEIPLTRKNARVGMKVICVDSRNSNLALKTGKEYTIKNVCSSLINVGTTKNSKEYDGWFMNRFVLAEG